MEELVGRVLTALFALLPLLYLLIRRRSRTAPPPARPSGEGNAEASGASGRATERGMLTGRPVDELDDSMSYVDPVATIRNIAPLRSPALSREELEAKRRRVENPADSPINPSTAPFARPAGEREAAEGLGDRRASLAAEASDNGRPTRARRSARSALLRRTSRHTSLRQAIILADILGKPPSLSSEGER